MLLHKATSLLRKVRLITKTSPYGVHVSDLFPIEVRKEDANESTLARYLFALGGVVWNKRTSVQKISHVASHRNCVELQTQACEH